MPTIDLLTRTFAAYLALLFVMTASAEIALIPQPVEMEVGEGSFSLRGPIVIDAEGSARGAARVLAHELTTRTRQPARLRSSSDSVDQRPVIVLDGALAAPSPEAYNLVVTEHGVRIFASGDAGFVWGCQTFMQLLHEGETGWLARCLTITDYPRFPWRGLLIDCSRTFKSLDYLRKTLDRMAYYKLNVLQLHLTDDQGWRLEIKKYPELTGRGARFEPECGEPERYQGFYSQEEMKGLIRYAAERGITIVPEIEMPGHSLAALACYPQLSCTGGPFKIVPSHQTRGLIPDNFCIGNDEVFSFLEDVLAEVIELFPSRYIHVGGDEAPKSRWKACPKCQARMRTEGLANEEELQSYFIRRIEKIINARGRVLMGWDEILEGGLAPYAAVMSWRGTEGGIAAARAGHPVVMTPLTHCYLDFTYEQIDSATAYSFEPIPAELTEAESQLILGVQGNMWSERNREYDQTDRQLYPRLLGIAERGWSPKHVRDYEAFSVRARAHIPALERMDVHYNPVSPLEP